MIIKVNAILKNVLEKVKPEENEIKTAEKILNEFIGKFNSYAKKLNIETQAFVGGSFAKNTMIKKDYYDADVFVRFDKHYNERKISELTKKILKKFVKGFKTIHGSRDYYRIQAGPKFFLEIIPVMKISKPREAQNVTDLSYSHVKYIKRKAKEKILDEILLAKAFCYANKCYGAESYINGFSGYALELLICYYKSFLKFARAMAKVSDKLIIDIEKKYKNKNYVLMDVNGSKLQSPVVLIDPTYKQRNALAALNDETFEKFKVACKKFLKNPSLVAFEIQKTNLEKIKKNAKKNKNEFILLEAITKKQEGDIAGSKLLKFYNHLTGEIEKFFVIKNKGFNYNKIKSARYFFVVKNKKEIVLSGPFVKQKENVKEFKRVHKRTFVKGKKVFAREKINFNLKKFIEVWKKKNAKKMREMSIVNLKKVE